jgi:putative ABC transport system ATP-binding protein
MIHLRGASKIYQTPAGPFPALHAIDLEIAAGELCAISGKSGSGKSTLLNIISGIDRATGGEVVVAGTSVHDAPERTLARWRGATVGVVFQFFQLLPTLTVLENVTLPMDFSGTQPVSARRERAAGLLARVGLADHRHKFPSQLSGGEQQRVAIARSLANDPPVVTADEPTGNLDSETAAAVLDLFVSLAAGGTTVVIATHDRDISRHASRTITLQDGRIAGEAA